MAVVTEYICDLPDCGESIDGKELVTIEITRSGETTITHLHSECLNEGMEGNDVLEAIVLHD